MSELDDWQREFLRKKCACRKEYRRQYYKAHKAERNAYDRAYYESHREELLAKARAERAERRKKLLPHSYYKKSDPLTINQLKSHEYYLQNRARIIACSNARYRRLRDERNDNQR